jgi:hypothetical protein
MGTLLAGALATLVFCAPGYPGTPADAQPLLDQFASAALAVSGWPAGSLAVLYDPTEEGGLAKLGRTDAVLAFVPYPFFVEHAAQLHLVALVQADVADLGPEQRWTLVAGSGRIPGPASMAGYTLLSVAGYAPTFVRRFALGDWALPADVRIESTGQVLSALRRVAAGEPVAILLDQTEAAALKSLAFASALKVVTQSPELPVAIVAVVDSRVTAARTQALKAGLLRMGRVAASADALAALRLRGFVPPRLPSRAAAP